jgi:hypothetical protein
MIEKIISGGQTGVDRGALEAAKELGVPTGGTAPYKFKTEKGFDKTLKDFGLEETAVRSYTYRTELNVKNADGTLIFMPIDSAGSRATLKYCEKLNKPVILNPYSPETVVDWIKRNKIKVLNVAGNRESKWKGIQDNTYNFMKETIKLLEKNEK